MKGDRSPEVARARVGWWFSVARYRNAYGWGMVTGWRPTEKGARRAARRKVREPRLVRDSRSLDWRRADDDPERRS